MSLTIFTQRSLSPTSTHSSALRPQTHQQQQQQQQQQHFLQHPRTPTPRTPTYENTEWPPASPSPYRVPKPIYTSNTYNYTHFASQYSQHNNNLRVRVSDPIPEHMPLENGHSQMTWNFGQQLSSSYNSNATNTSLHQRTSSNSSVASVGPATPYNNNHSNNNASPQLSAPDYYDGLSNTDPLYQKPLPTPQHTPLREVFSYQNFSQPVISEPSIMTLQQKAFPQPRNDEQAAPADYLQRPSGPSRNESSESFEGSRKMDYQSQIPKLDRTMSDVFADELYSPNFSLTSAPPQPRKSTESSPTQVQTLIAQRLQAANSQHLSASFPMANTPRDRSPFRHGSPLEPSSNAFTLSPLSAARMREQKKAERDAEVLEQQMRKHSPGQDAQQTISPKDALLEYHESEDDADMPLFAPQKSPPSYSAPKLESNQADDTESLQSFGSMATSRRESCSAYSGSSQTTTQPTTAFNFAPPAIPGQVEMPQVPQQYPFVTHATSQNSTKDNNANGENVPEFHSTLHSMESSSSDYVPDSEHAKPTNVSSDGGTYTCTYQGCTLRFDTPAKLQRHKKDGHRQVGSMVVGGHTRSGSEGVTARNSQAGPHRCDRINPSTGKPCNTVFSRPYDLTRHEDTIHNSRHQKIRCKLCTEVKTFSRNDALTRHFRVVHPEVELPVKSRRRQAD